MFLESDSTVYYDTSKASSPEFVKNSIVDNIILYSNSSQLNKFGARFKYSKYVGMIDNSQSSITSNITHIYMRRDLEPALNTYAEYEICYGNRIHIKREDGYNIKSSGFYVSGISDCVYMGDLPGKDLKTGTVFLFKLNSPTQPVVVKRAIGVIDYVKGEIMLNPLNVISTKVTRGVTGAEVPVIEISMCPYSNDVIGLQDLYLQLDNGNTKVTMIPDEISSGTNVSGTSYKVTSSYANGSLVRGIPHLTSSSSSNGNGTTTTTTVVPSNGTTTSTPSTPSTGGGSGY